MKHLFKGNIVKKIIFGKKGIIFDPFHTLTARESTWSSGVNTSDILGVTKEKWNEQLLEKSRDRLTGKEKNPFVFVRQMAHAINPHISDELIERAVKFRIERMKKAVTLIPATTIQTLNTLKGQGKKLGLLSNADASEMAGWKGSPIAPFFDSTVFSCEVGYVKPEHQIYEISLQQLALAPEDCGFIGDGGSHELEGAKKLGIMAVFIAGVIRELWPDKIEARMKIADDTIEELDELVS
jgi:putative hydrolase of the HAD superfamily